MSRTASSFSRKKPSKQPKQTTLIICEDTKSSLTYLNEAINFYRVRVRVEAIHCKKTDPHGILSYAIDNKRNHEKIFCVIDKDTHPSYAQTMGNAISHTPAIEMIQSVPCFELWIILHFKKHEQPYQRSRGLSVGQQAVIEVQKIPNLKHYQKGEVSGLFSVLEPHLETAIANANWLENQCQANQTDNPSTRMHHLIIYLQNLAA